MAYFRKLRTKPVRWVKRKTGRTQELNLNRMQERSGVFVDDQRSEQFRHGVIFRPANFVNNC
jgi:hypothetical protein